MGKIIQYRRWILGMAVSILFLPTYVILANPVVGMDVTPDFSWTKDLPELLFLVVAAVVIIGLLVYLFTRIFPKQETKVQDPKDPSKTTTVPELTVVSFNMMAQAFNNNSHLVEIVVDAIGAFKDELIQGRANQLIAINDVHDTVSTKLLGMQSALQTRNEQMERVSGGLLHLQNGQTQMQQDIGSLLEETRNLTKSIINILTRLEGIDTAIRTVDNTIGDVSQSTLTIKDDLKALTTAVQSIDDRLNKISIAAGTTSLPTPPPEMKPDAILIEQPKNDPLSKPDQNQKEGLNE